MVGPIPNARNFNVEHSILRYIGGRFQRPRDGLALAIFLINVFLQFLFVRLRQVALVSIFVEFNLEIWRSNLIFSNINY